MGKEGQLSRPKGEGWLSRARGWWRGRREEEAPEEDARAMLELLLEWRSITPQDLLPTRKSNKPEWVKWDTKAAITDGLKASSWVYTCCSKIAEAIAGIPWRTERRSAEGWVPDESSPLRDLLEKPNVAWSWDFLIQQVVLHLLLGGNAVISKVKVGGVPVELWPWNPGLIRPIPSTTEFIAGYEVKDSTEKRTLKPEDTIHLMLPDPENPRWGMSPMMAASKAVDTDREAANWQKVTLEQLAIPPVIFTFDKGVSEEMVKANRDLYKKQWGGSKNARAAMFLGNNPKINRVALTPAELDWLATRELNAEEIAATFGIPAPVVGLMRRATFKNIETAERMWWEQKLIPAVEAIIRAFNRQLASEFGPDVRFAPDFTKVPALLTRIEQKINMAEKLFGLGVTRNELNQYLGLGLPDGGAAGDIAYVRTNLRPVTASSDGADTA